MVALTADSDKNLPFSFDERILIRSSSRGSLESTSSATSTKTVRLESLAQWKGDSWIHPFPDIDLGLSSGSSNYKNLISRVDMSISSHGAQHFPSNAEGLDHIPKLSLWSNTSFDENDRYLSKPQGFFLSILPVNGLTPEEEATAVQAVFQELIRSRLLTTPVMDGEWDILEDQESNQMFPRRLYQLIIPFDGAAWSSDALGQSFRRTLPEACGDEHSSSENNRFFGWSALEWSNFLVGYKDGGGELGRGGNQTMQHLTFNKLMWWTWTNDINNSDLSLSFGIQYQTTIPSNTNDWLPENFLDKKSKCKFGERAALEVFPASTGNNYHLVPITAGRNENEHKGKESLVSVSSNFLYSVGIEQVLRRHHTNQGRFESLIDLNPLFDTDDDNFISCRMKYRQVFPNFLSPMWRSLRITTGDNDDTGAMNEFFYTNSEQLQASVEWNAEDKSSVLTVEVFTHQNEVESRTLPSSFSVSLEYAPAFLTIDDFPGDPNRGRVLPPASITVRCSSPTASTPQNTKTVAYSNSLLLLPPVPDLSMPFNVISLTSSLYAYIIGAIITILVRKGSEKIKYKMYPDMKPNSKLTNAKTKLREKLDRIKAKLLGKSGAKANKKHEDLKHKH